MVRAWLGESLETAAYAYMRYMLKRYSRTINAPSSGQGSYDDFHSAATAIGIGEAPVRMNNSVSAAAI